MHDLVDRDVEAEVLAGERPRRLELVDVLHHEHETGRVARRQRQVVAAERVLREVADHRPGLHAEQRGGEHLHDPAEHLGAEPGDAER